MKITVVGVGYVGLVTAACFADLGNRVIALDISEEKIQGLERGEMPIYEPGLKELVDRNVKAGRISFTTSYQDGLKGSDFVFIAVGTPSGVDGEADLQHVAAAAETIAKFMRSPLIIVNKSTVPVGTGDWVAEIVRKHQTEPIPFSVVSCPEFLREGSAISDFMQPYRTVLGSLDPDAAETTDLAAQLAVRVVLLDVDRVLHRVADVGLHDRPVVHRDRDVVGVVPVAEDQKEDHAGEVQRRLPQPPPTARRFGLLHEDVAPLLLPPPEDGVH